MLRGSFSGLGTDSKSIDGTDCCASAGDAKSSRHPSSAHLMSILPDQTLLVFAVGTNASLLAIAASIAVLARPSLSQRITKIEMSPTDAPFPCAMPSINPSVVVRGCDICCRDVARRPAGVRGLSGPHHQDRGAVCARWRHRRGGTRAGTGDEQES